MCTQVQANGKSLLLGVQDPSVVPSLSWDDLVSTKITSWFDIPQKERIVRSRATEEEGKKGKKIDLRDFSRVMDFDGLGLSSLLGKRFCLCSGLQGLNATFIIELVVLRFGGLFHSYSETTFLVCYVSHSFEQVSKYATDNESRVSQK